jgi:hypothetical protein
MKAGDTQTPHRIALVTGGLPFGGSTTFLVNFAGELVRRKIPVKVLSLEWDNPLGGDFQKQNIPLTRFDDRKMILEDRLSATLRELADFQPTVIAATLGSVSFEILRYVPPGVFRIGMGQSDDPNVYNMMRRYTQWMDLAAMVSQGMKQKVSAMPEYAKVPVAYLPLGVPMCAAEEIPARNPSAPLRILYLGRLGREQKRVHLFPEILKHLRASGMPFEWTIAGEGEERSHLEANLKSESPHQTVTFTGPIPYAEVSALLKRHDIYLLASDYEGLPLSLLEAMGHGLVPVVSDLKSGIPEVVDTVNGMLVPIHETAGYANAIFHLHQHREEWAAKSAAARTRVVREFSVAAMADRWLGAFPNPPGTKAVWPKRFSVKAPLEAEKAFYFSPPVRILRRAARLMKSGRN